MACYAAFSDSPRGDVHHRGSLEIDPPSPKVIGIVPVGIEKLDWWEVIARP